MGLFGWLVLLLDCVCFAPVFLSDLVHCCKKGVRHCLRVTSELLAVQPVGVLKVHKTILLSLRGWIAFIYFGVHKVSK